MDTIFVHLHRVRTHRVIDVTPVPWWRRAARAASALSIVAVAVPLLWLLGGLFALLLLGRAAAMLAHARVRRWRLGRAARRSAQAWSPSTPDPSP